MTTELFLVLIRAIIAICGVVVTVYLVPFIKEKFTAAQLEEISYYVSVAVRCAEQIYTPDQWRDKKTYVVNYIKDKLNYTFNIDLSESDINAIVEGIVHEIKHGGASE